MNSKVVLKSGKELEITLAPFDEAKSLYQAVAEEVKALKVDAEVDMDVNFFKDLALSGLSSKKIDSALSVCMKRCAYNGQRIASVKDSFESIEAREDYFEVCFEVGKANLLPFTKSLYAQFVGLLKKEKINLA